LDKHNCVVSLLLASLLCIIFFSAPANINLFHTQ
jgi:hypothetical protein